MGIVDKVALILIILASMSVIFFEKYSLKQIIFLLFILLIGILCFLFKRENWLYFFIISLSFVKSYDEKTFKRLLFTFCAVILFTVFSNRVGIINQYVMLRGDINRYSFGFLHPNILGAISMTTIFLYVYLKSGYLSKISYCALFLSIYAVYYFTESRSSVFMTSLFLLACLIKQNKKIDKIQAAIGIFIPITFFMTSYIFSKNYQINTSIYYYLDKILSSRISLAHSYLIQYPVRAFGNSISFIGTYESSITYGTTATILDNAYIRFLLVDGWVITLVLLILLTGVQLRNYLNKDYLLSTILTFFLAYGLFERYLFDFTINIFLLTILLCVQIRKRKNLNANINYNSKL